MLVEKEEVDITKLNEEINLLYVAVTRARNHLYVPESLVPEGVVPTPSLHILKTEETEEHNTSRSQTV
ncbi:hypothetical protein N9811_01030 [Bacteroidia bacterium]|nr:hypothetical protein [Bacteroidia bacterium]